MVDQTKAAVHVGCSEMAEIDKSVLLLSLFLAIHRLSIAFPPTLLFFFFFFFFLRYNKLVVLTIIKPSGQLGLHKCNVNDGVSL